MQNIEKPKAVLLDLDGVLIDTEALNGEAWRRAAEFFGKSIDKIQLQKLLGRPRNDCAKDIQSLLNEHVKMDELLSVHLPIQRELIKNCKAIDSAERLVRWLNLNSVPNALVTSSGIKSVQFKISLHPWIDLIPIKIFGDDPFLEIGKPAPEPFLLAAKRLKINPQDCWVIEDSESGIKSALSANCKVWQFNKNAENKCENKGNNLTTINDISIVLKYLKKYF